MSKRNFTVELCEIEDIGGHFVGTTPIQAAKKAARKIFKLKPKSTMVQFTIRETTSGSAQKEYKYVATKVTLDTPKVIQRGPVSITVNTEYVVKPLKV